MVGGGSVLNPVRLIDLAKEIGISVNTVSRALRDMPDVTDDTKNNVKEAAKRLGYLHNHAASMIRTKRSNTIGVIVTDISNPVFGGMVKGIDSAAKKNSYTIILSNTNENYKDEENAIRTMLEGRVDGILLVPTMIKAGTVNGLMDKKIPYVLLGRHFPNIVSNLVSNDDIFGGYLAGKHLISRGHKEFIYITGPLFISSAQERLDGFIKAIEENGLLKSSIRVYETEASLQGGYETVRSLINKGKLVSSIFCFSDFIAFGVLKALQEKSILIPDEVAVMGYDDIEFSEAISPSLTTIDMSKFRLGKRAVELLVQYINAPPEERTYRQLIMEPVLVVRKST